MAAPGLVESPLEVACQPASPTSHLAALTIHPGRRGSTLMNRIILHGLLAFENISRTPHRISPWARAHAFIQSV